VKHLRFIGNIDDTFGEYGWSRDEYDNCASGEPIEWEVMDAEGKGVLVIGQYSNANNGAWTIGVTPWHNHRKKEDPVMPPWAMRFEQPGQGEAPYSPVLVIEAPDDISIRCLQREVKP